MRQHTYPFKDFLRTRPIIFGLTIFNLVWTWMNVPDVTCCPHVDEYRDAAPALVLFVSSSLLLLDRAWTNCLLLVLGELALVNLYNHTFWRLAINYEVPMYSYEHLSVWWPNLTWPEFLRIILTLAVLIISLYSLVKWVRQPKVRSDF